MNENKQKETTDDQIVSTTSEITIQIAEEFIAERKITIIDPLSDFGFKRLMATERNKDILIGFLNTFISNDAGIIVDVTFLPTSQIGVTPDEKRVRFDLYCKTAGNDHIIIEMQRGRQAYYANRIRAYTSRAITNSVKRGDSVYKTVPRVYSVNLMDYNMAEFQGRDRFFWTVYQKDNDNQIFSKGIVLYFIEFRKFAAQLEMLDMTDVQNRWLYMFTHVMTIKEREMPDQNSIFRRFYEECRITNLTDMEKQEYVKSVLEYEDVQEMMMCERDIARKEGREEGRADEKRQLARNMLEKGIDPALVAEITGLTVDEVSMLTANG